MWPGWYLSQSKSNENNGKMFFGKTKKCLQQFANSSIPILICPLAIYCMEDFAMHDLMAIYCMEDFAVHDLTAIYCMEDFAVHDLKPVALAKYKIKALKALEAWAS